MSEFAPSTHQDLPPHSDPPWPLFLGCRWLGPFESSVGAPRVPRTYLILRNPPFLLPLPLRPHKLGLLLIWLRGHPSETWNISHWEEEGPLSKRFAFTIKLAFWPHDKITFIKRESPLRMESYPPSPLISTDTAAGVVYVLERYLSTIRAKHFDREDGRIF